MNIRIRKYEERDAAQMTRIWNRVITDGVAFPQTEELSEAEGAAFFAAQTFTAAAEDTETGRVVGLYILHPNNVGRCGHIANASYAVDAEIRGQHIGEQLVRHCIRQAHEEGFRILQFNAVVYSNIHARHLYERCGFRQLGVIPGGFLMDDGHYEDICLYYMMLGPNRI